MDELRKEVNELQPDMQAVHAWREASRRRKHVKERSTRLHQVTAVFVFIVLLFTGVDWLVNSLLYEYGLQFNIAWHLPYLIAYFLLYQIVIWLSFAYCENRHFLLITQAFVCSGGQDIICFVVWNKMDFPQYWNWLPYELFGAWTTELQFLLSSIVILLAFGATTLFEPYRTSME